MKIIAAVISIVLISGISVRADDQMVQTGQLLLELEQSIKASWQAPSWTRSRVTWRERVQSAPDVATLGQLVLELKQSLKTDALNGDWSENTQRGWQFACGMVRNVSSLGQIMTSLERQIVMGAQEDSWGERRDAWVAQVSGIVQQTRSEMIRAASKAAGLLLELERATRYSWQIPGWAQERDSWIARVRGATGPLTLSSEVFAFEQSLKREALGSEWHAQRSDTSISLFSAATISEVGIVLIRLERFMKFEAQEDSWRQRREQWVLEAKAL